MLAMVALVLLNLSFKRSVLKNLFQVLHLTRIHQMRTFHRQLVTPRSDTNNVLIVDFDQPMTIKRIQAELVINPIRLEPLLDLLGFDGGVFLIPTDVQQLPQKSMSSAESFGGLIGRLVLQFFDEFLTNLWVRDLHWPSFLDYGRLKARHNFRITV